MTTETGKIRVYNHQPTTH